MKTNKITCKYCQVEFIQKTRYLKKPIFCSRTCANRYRGKMSTKKWISENQNNCLVCGNIFVSKNKNQKCCSSKCAGILKSKVMKIKCSHCRLIFRQTCTKQKFCSFLCYIQSKPKLIVKKCLYCGRSFKVHDYVNKRSDMSGSFCSVSCVNSFRIGKNNPNWHGGKSFESYDIKFNVPLKRSVLEKHGYKCVLCGSKIKLIVHHIDYNKQNSNVGNLIVLCRHCHGKVNVGRETWEKIFIGIRRKLQG